MSKTLQTEVEIEAVEKQASAVFDGEAVVLQLEQGMYYGLNEVGSFVWDRLQKHRYSIQALCEEVASVYEVEPSECQKDIETFVEALLDRGLIRIIHAKAA